MAKTSAAMLGMLAGLLWLWPVPVRAGASAHAGASVAASRPAARLIDSMDDPSLWRVSGGSKSKVVTCSACEGAAARSKAVAIGVKEGAIFGIALRVFKPDAVWNGFDGLSFRLKGDGSDNWGCIRLQAGSYSKGWVGNFPLKEAGWREVRLAWGDLVPVSTAVAELGSADGFRPGDVNLVAFGKSWNFNTRHKKPAIGFCVDELKLIRGVKASRQRVPIAKLPPLSGVVEKLKAGEAVTILTLGDSITWGTNVGGNPEAYPALLGKMLEARYGNERVRIVNRAIGGSTTCKGRQWLNRDVRGLDADLVTVMFGFNQRPGGDRAKATEAFTASLVRYVEEVAGAVRRPPACILIATIPGNKANWERLDCYAQGIRELGKKHPNVTVADANAHFKKMGQPAYAKLMSDEAHPNRAGQQEMAEVLLRTIAGEAPAGKEAR